MKKAITSATGQACHAGILKTLSAIISQRIGANPAKNNVSKIFILSLVKQNFLRRIVNSTACASIIGLFYFSSKFFRKKDLSNVPPNKFSQIFLNEERKIFMEMETDKKISETDKKFSVTVKVPGTSANCGPGFDCLGLALTIYNELELTLLEENQLVIESKGESADLIPTDEKNIVWKSARMVLDRAGQGEKFKGAIIKMNNHIPMSRGLGSSAAAIVAGLVGANAVIGNPFNKQEILKFATEIEGHPDNVAPAIFGGFTVSVVEKGQVQTFSFLPKIKLKMIVAVPNFQLSTRTARQVLPKTVPLKDAIFNISRASMLIAALIQGKENFLTNAFDDSLHQPYRKDLVPGMNEVFESAKKFGALGVALSGAGPCLIAFSAANKHIENDIATEMIQAFKKNEVQANALILDLDTQGAFVNH